MKHVAKILLRPVVPERYIRAFCLVSGAVILCAGIALIFAGHHGLLFVLLGSLCLLGGPQRKTS